jgi:uncharacterized LabA/DUF88 family protein
MCLNHGIAALFIEGPKSPFDRKSAGLSIWTAEIYLPNFEAGRPPSRAFGKNQEYFGVRGLLDRLDYNGFTVVSKPIKEFADESGRRKPSRLHPGILHHAH